MPSKPKQLFAFFVAIEKYPDPVRSLKGCIKDYNHFCTFLSDHCKNEDYNFVPLALCNEQATRINIIEGFSHFESSQDGDICIFYYSGHGAQQDVLEVFKHLESDNKQESLVCYDSRPNGWDLMDKELSYLLWKATRDKKIHFLVVMDCCHANRNMRGKEKKASSKLLSIPMVRSLEGNTKPRPVTSYLGYNEYRRSPSGAIMRYEVDYVQLSACQSNEKAQEVFVEDGVRGVFTYSLLQALEQRGASLSYLDLIRKTRMNLVNLLSGQEPALEAWPTINEQRPFLGGAFTSTRKEYNVVHQEAEGWVIDGGKLHGFCGQDEGEPSKFRLLGEGREIWIENAGPTHSAIKGMKGIYIEDKFLAKLIRDGRRAMVVSFAPDIDHEGKKILEKELFRLSDLHIRLSDGPSGSEYFIHAGDQVFYLSALLSGHPLFPPVKGYTSQSAIDFIEKIGVVSNWLHVKAWQQHPSYLSGGDIELRLYRITETKQYADDAPADLLTIDTKHPIDFPYLYEEEEWKEPAFRLQVKNKSNRLLYLSGLLLGYDFSVTNELLVQEPLAPKGELSLLQHFKGIPYKSIGLEIEDEYFETGITQATDYLKILVSTTPIHTSEFNRMGLPFFGPKEKGKGPYRSDYKRAKEEEEWNDWFIVDLEFQVFRPMAPSLISSKVPFRYGSITLHAPPKCNARVKFSNLEEWKRAVGIQKMGLSPQGDQLNPLVFKDQLHYAAGLCVIELFDLGADEGTLKLDKAICLEFPEDWDQILEPVDWDPDKRHFRMLKSQRESNSLLIWELPAPTPCYPEGAGFSRKILVHQRWTNDA